MLCLISSCVQGWLLFLSPAYYLLALWWFWLLRFCREWTRYVFCPLRASKEGKMCILLGDYGDKLTMTTLSQSITSLTQNHSHLGWKRLLRSSIPASTSLYLCHEMAFILHGDPEKSLVLAQPFWIPFCGLMPSSSSSYGLISNCSLCYTHVPQT